MIHEITMVREPSLALRALHRRHLYKQSILWWQHKSHSVKNGDSGAFLKTQRHNFKGHKNTNLCLFNPIFNPIICMSVIKTQICRTSPPRCANLCPDISLTYIFISPVRISFSVSTWHQRHAVSARHHRTLPPPLPLSHAVSLRCRHRRRRCRTQPPHAVLRCRRRRGRLLWQQRWDCGSVAWTFI
jgi:hypothetical protein